MTVTDERRNQCDFSQETLPESGGEDDEEDEADYVCTTFKPGSLVLGKMCGYPW